MRELTETERKIKLEGADILDIAGIKDRNLEMIRGNFKASITMRGEVIKIKGEEEEVKRIETIFKELVFLQKRQGRITESDVNLLLHLTGEPDTGNAELKLGFKSDEIDDVIYADKSSFVKAKTPGQRKFYFEALSNDIVFVIGPAGTGKTYLSVAMALAALKNKTVNRIILSRPAVEAGESLGFLPGDLSEKVNPYLKPLFDALEEMLPFEKLKSYFEKNIIEVVPLAYMRGRTLNNAFLILDEAQNATAMQMKMFLTRLGVNSKTIVTGDITQIDLPPKQASGLVQIQGILSGIEGVVFVYLDKKDVVRHRLVKNIIEAYEKFSNGKTNKEASEKSHPNGNNQDKNSEQPA